MHPYRKTLETKRINKAISLSLAGASSNIPVSGRIAPKGDSTTVVIFSNPVGNISSGRILLYGLDKELAAEADDTDNDVDLDGLSLSIDRLIRELIQGKEELQKEKVIKIADEIIKRRKGSR